MSRYAIVVGTFYRELAQKLVASAREVFENAGAEGVDVFGPADAPLGLVRGRRRKRFLVRAERRVDLQGFLTAWRARL